MVMCSARKDKKGSRAHQTPFPHGTPTPQVEVSAAEAASLAALPHVWQSFLHMLDGAGAVLDRHRARFHMQLEADVAAFGSDTREGWEEFSARAPYAAEVWSGDLARCLNADRECF